MPTQPGTATAAAVSHVKLRKGRTFSAVVVAAHSASTMDESKMKPVPEEDKEYLIGAVPQEPFGLKLTFRDGLVGVVNLNEFGFEAGKLLLSTARASVRGSAAEIQDPSGHVIHIDSTVLRAKLDPRFAAGLLTAIQNLMD